MSLFENKSLLKSASGMAIANIQNGQVQGFGGVSTLIERDNELCSISGMTIFKIFDNSDGTKEITDAYGHLVFEVTTGGEVLDVYGHLMYIIE